MRRDTTFVSLLLTIVFLMGASCQKRPNYLLPVTHLKVKGLGITAEVANHPMERQMGLMFRRELGKDDGMLFVFPDMDGRSFWMKNTLIPLSIAFMDEKGVILNVLEMPPLTEKSFFSKGPAKYVLEMNSGWFSRHGIGAGDAMEGVLQAPNGE